MHWLGFSQPKVVAGYYYSFFVNSVDAGAGGGAAAASNFPCDNNILATPNISHFCILDGGNVFVHAFEVRIHNPPMVSMHRSHCEGGLFFAYSCTDTHRALANGTIVEIVCVHTQRERERRVALFTNQYFV